MNSRERSYRVVKVPFGSRFATYVVVSEDLADPDVWVVINQCESAFDAWRYIEEVTTRNRQLSAPISQATPPINVSHLGCEVVA